MSEQSGEDDEGEYEFSSDLGLVAHRATVAFGGWLLGLSGTETVAVGDEEWEEGEPRIFWNFGYKNICKKKCCYKCCEVNKIICLLQLLILVAIIAALAALIYAETQGGRRKKKRRKRSSSNTDMFSRSDAIDSLNSLDSIDYLDYIDSIDAVLEGIAAAFTDLREETRVMAVEYEPLRACPAAVAAVGRKNGTTAESCARWSWTSAGGPNQTLLPPIEAFGQECF